jgi:RNA polymerase sigma-70 factor, ECF subfamily
VVRNFSFTRHITSLEGRSPNLMQDAISALVLDSEAAQPTKMNDTSSDASAEIPASETDEQLMVAFARGSADAFNLLFLRYKQPLFGFFCRRLTDPSQAEELTQETFLAILRATARYEASALFRTYLYAIGLKILRAHRRKTAFRAVFRGEQPPGQEPAMHCAMDTDLLISQAVGKLEHLDREILLLREFEQQSYTEIATLLSLPVNTVRSRLFRARMALRDLLTAPAPHSVAKNLSESEEHV